MNLVPKTGLIDTADNDVNPVHNENAGGNQLFPVFLKLNELHTVVIGAGKVGLEKLTAIMHNCNTARVTVVSKTVIAEIRTLAITYPGISINEKTFIDSDLDGADLVIAATDDSALNAYIRESAHQRKLLINVADKPELCDFYLGSIVKKGDLKIGISTNGKSPTIAKRLREVLDDSIPNEIDITLQQLSNLRNTLTGDFADKVKHLNEVTSVLVEPKIEKKNLRWLIWLFIVVGLGVAITALWFNEPEFKTYAQQIDPIFYYFLTAGFVFAMVDGAIGMSYGVTSTAFSISMGISPASASMAVHLSEIMSNGIAGWMHYRMGNVNWKLFKLLIIPGILGAAVGAGLISSLEHYAMYTKPLVSIYTLILGGVILSKAFKTTKKKSADKIKKISLLGLGGGFIDALGGGGWGSIVLSSLIAGGRHPRFSLGTVKLTRFFIAMIGSLVFLTMLNNAPWSAIAGLIIGSALAAPIAARISNRISVKVIMVAVGIIVILVSLKSIVAFIGKVI